jgi:hypothetical protein
VIASLSSAKFGNRVYEAASRLLRQRNDIAANGAYKYLSRYLKKTPPNRRFQNVLGPVNLMWLVISSRNNLIIGYTVSDPKIILVPRRSFILLGGNDLLEPTR